MDFTVSEVIANQALTASLYVNQDLGVNGISYLWVHVTGLQAAANTLVTPDNLLGVLDTVTVLFNGQQIIAGRARELARLGALITNTAPVYTAAANGANAETGLAFVLPFGRRLFDPAEGFPVVQRGQLQLAITANSAFTGLVSPELTVQQVELPGNQFRRYNKYTQRVATPAATGNYDVPLPIGNVLRGVLARATTRWRNLNVPGTIRSAIVLANNSERFYTGGQLGHAQWLAHQRMGDQAQLHRHAKLENVAGAYAQFAATDLGQANTDEFMANYAYLDLDWLKGDEFSLQTQGLADLTLRLDIATSAEEIRTLAYESVAIAGR